MFIIIIFKNHHFILIVNSCWWLIMRLIIKVTEIWFQKYVSYWIEFLLHPKWFLFVVSVCNNGGRYHIVSIRHSKEAHDDAVWSCQGRHNVQEHPRLLGEDRQDWRSNGLLQGRLLQRSAWYRRCPCTCTIRRAKSNPLGDTMLGKLLNNNLNCSFHQFYVG